MYMGASEDERDDGCGDGEYGGILVDNAGGADMGGKGW
jgi:hypothetical protein